jgi:hydroxymethylbilane synthase
VVAERAALAALEAGCSAPVAAYAVLADGGTSEEEDGPELYLRASVTALDGSDAVRDSVTGPVGDAERLGRALAAELLDRGAAELMATGRDVPR